MSDPEYQFAGKWHNCTHRKSTGQGLDVQSEDVGKQCIYSARDPHR